MIIERNDLNLIPITKNHHSKLEKEGASERNFKRKGMRQMMIPNLTLLFDKGLFSYWRTINFVSVSMTDFVISNIKYACNFCCDKKLLKLIYYAILLKYNNPSHWGDAV